MNIAAFLLRGLAWGIVGLSLLKASPTGPMLWIIAAGWLAGLAALGWITSRGSEKDRYSAVMAWSMMGAWGLLLAAVVIAVR